MIKTADWYSAVNQKRSAFDRGIAFLLLCKFGETKDFDPARRGAEDARQQPRANQRRSPGSIDDSQAQRFELGVEIPAVYPSDEIPAIYYVDEIFRSARIIEQLQPRTFSGESCEIDRRARTSSILETDVPMLDSRYRRSFAIARHYLPVGQLNRPQD